MQTIGERLLEARQRRGVSIREAAESTKVRGDYLAAMENNQFDSIPLADVYRRGFLKIYARFLRLDSDRVVNDFNALLAARNPGAVRTRRATDLPETPARTIEPREPEAPDEFSSGAIEVAERPDNRRKFILIGGAVSLLAIIVVAVMLSRSGEKTTREPAQNIVPTTVAQGEVVFTSRHNRPVVVRVVNDADNVEVFNAEIQPGASATMRGTGSFVVYANPLDKIEIRRNGQNLSRYPVGSGSGRLPVETPKGR